MPQSRIQVSSQEAFAQALAASMKQTELGFDFLPLAQGEWCLKEVCDLLAHAHKIQALALNFSGNRLTEENVQALATFLQSRHCPDSIHLLLNHVSLHLDSLSIFAEALAKGCVASKIQLELSQNKLQDRGAQILADALMSSNCCPNMVVNLALNDISDQGVSALAQMLRAKTGVKDIALNLLFNSTTVAGTQALIAGMHCRAEKNRLSIKYEFGKHGMDGIADLSRAISGNHCPRALSLQFGTKHLSTHEIRLLFTGLASLTSSDNLTFDLSEQGLDDDAFMTLLETLPSIKNGMYIDLSLVCNQIKQRGATKLAEFIRSNTLGATIKIDLRQNTLGGDDGLHALCQALIENPEILHNLSLRSTPSFNQTCRAILEQLESAAMHSFKR